MRAALSIDDMNERSAILFIHYIRDDGPEGAETCRRIY